LSLKLIVKSLKWKRVTRKYPFEQHPVPEDFRGRVEFLEELCMGCGACANVCPPNAIQVIEEKGTRIIKLFIGRCIFCGRCEENCPMMAVKQTDDFELSSIRREDLEVVLRHGLPRDEKGHFLEYTEREIVEAEEVLRSERPRELVEKLIESSRKCRSCRIREGIGSIAKALRPGGERNE